MARYWKKERACSVRTLGKASAESSVARVRLLRTIISDHWQSEADRTLIYLTLYITECLKRLQKCANKNAALNEMYTLAISRFDIPGEAGFPLNAVYGKPKDDAEAGGCFPDSTGGEGGLDQSHL